MENPQISNPYAPPISPAAIPGAVAPDIPLATPIGFGARALARIVDNVVVMLVGFVGGMAGGLLGGLAALMGLVDGDLRGRLSSATASSYVVALLGPVVYHALSEGIGGATIGKLLIRARVRREDLTPCTFGAALGRSFAYYIDGFFFGMVAYGSMSSSPTKQRLGDKWAHTVVVTAESDRSGVGGSRVAIGIAAGMAVVVVLHVFGVLLKLL